MTHGLWEQIGKHQEAFGGLLAWGDTRFNLTRGGESRFADGLYVSGDFFRVLGVDPIVGRTFAAQDDTPGCPFGAVVSHAFWQRELGGDPNVLGRRLSLDGHPVAIVGVTPASFLALEVGDRYDVAVPLCAEPLFAPDGKSQTSTAHAWWLSMMGRPRPGWTVPRIQAHLRALSPVIMQATLPAIYGSEARKKYLANQIEVRPAAGGISDLRDRYGPALWLMLATSAFVLLIACANIANLLLARGRVREREIAIRLAIGASRGRLVRQLLIESLLLAAAGTLAGILLARSLSRALVTFISNPADPLALELPVDWRLLGFAAGLALATCLLFGLLPALRATHLAPAGSLRGGGRTMSGGRERLSLRRTLVVGQVALSLMLLVGALLFSRSLRNLLTTDPGFQAEGIYAVELDLARADIPPERRPEVFRALHASLSALPGVQSAAQARFAPVERPVLEPGHRTRQRTRHQQRQDRDAQPGRARLLSHPGHPAARRAGVRPRRHAGGAPGGHRQRGARPGILRQGQRRRPHLPHGAGPRRAGGVVPDCRRGRRREVLRPAGGAGHPHRLPGERPGSGTETGGHLPAARAPAARRPGEDGDHRRHHGPSPHRDRARVAVRGRCTGPCGASASSPRCRAPSPCWRCCWR